MATSKSTKKKKSSGSGGGAQQFLVWHGEKFVVALVVVIALWFSMQGLSYLGQTISWQPSELETSASDAEQTIRASTRTAEDEEITLFDYAAYAEQIKSSVSAEPYRASAVWNPMVDPNGQRSLSGAAGGRRSSDSGSSY